MSIGITIAVLLLGLWAIYHLIKKSKKNKNATMSILDSYHKKITLARDANEVTTTAATTT